MSQRLLAILTVRNEGAFLLDWLAWHRHVGFTDFLVFSNDCDDGTDRMLDRLSDLGWLTHCPNPGPHAEGAQWAALKAANGHPLRRAAQGRVLVSRMGRTGPPARAIARGRSGWGRCSATTRSRARS